MNNNLQPYQRASEEQQRQADIPGKVLKKAVGAATSIAGGSAVLSRALPFLSSFVPFNLAKKGLSKIDSRFGKFIDAAQANGSDEEEVREFIRSKIEEKDNKATSEQKPPDERSIIEQYSPELFNFIKGEIGKGRSPIEAGALAQSKNEFKKIIGKMSQDHKAPFSSILESIFGSAQQPQGQPQAQEQAQPNQQQGNQSDQALMAALDKILKM